MRILCVFYKYRKEIGKMPMTPKEMVKLLQKNGFVKKNKNGSHQKMYNPKTNLTTSVPMHNKDLGVGLEHKILKQAGLK